MENLEFTHKTAKAWNKDFREVVFKTTPKPECFGNCPKASQIKETCCEDCKHLEECKKEQGR